jgi:hypothetical protein
MKKKLTGMFGFGDKGELWVCDRCGKQLTIPSNANKYGLFESLKTGDFCFDCLKTVDKDATHLWISLNGANDHFSSTFIEEMNSSPPTHLDYCSKCYTYRSIQKLGGSLRASYYPIGTKVATADVPICRGENREDLNSCHHDYVKVFSNERTPSSSEVKESKKLLREIQGNIVGQVFGYTSIDMARSTYGFSVYWCCKCGAARTITKGQHLPAFGTDRNFPSRYST